MSDKPIAVLGGGHGGHCMAAELTLRGYDVHLYEQPGFIERFRPTLERGEIELTGIGLVGKAKICRVTTDMAEAVAGAETINLVVAGMGHDAVFESLIPHLEDGHIVVCWAGDYASLRLAKLLRDHGVDKKIYIVEGNTLPYGTRISGPGKVDLLLVAPFVLVAALPAKDNPYISERLKPIFPCVELTRHVVAAALNNPNPIVHPPGSLLNTGRIQYSGGEFYMYREGITHAVARVIRRVFNEVSAVAEALDSTMIQYEERDFWTTASIMGVAFQAPFDTLGIIANVIGPKSIYDRYIIEDLPYGLVPTSELGKALQVPTPLIDSIVEVGGAVCDIDFWETGRTLETLGIDQMSREELLSYLLGD